MLSALDHQLRTLAQDSYNQFREEVSERENGKPTEEQLSALKEFIFLLPATLKQLSLYWNRKDTPPDAKRVSGFIITYIYEPNDFLPQARHGLFGYLDDAYLVVQAYLKIQDQFLRDWHRKSQEELALIERARQLIVAPQLIIPDVTVKIDRLVDSLMKGDTAEFDKAMSGGGS
jgi:uncharacterized membrane protein YkvA (DUF1232 family)